MEVDTEYPPLPPIPLGGDFSTSATLCCSRTTAACSRLGSRDTLEDRRAGVCTADNGIAITRTTEYRVGETAANHMGK